MAKFKIGDRVKMHEHHRDSKAINIGWLGTVVDVKEESSRTRVGVSWDELKSGHNCDLSVEELAAQGLRVSSCRWMDDVCLRLVVDEVRPEVVPPTPAKPAEPKPAKPPKPKPWFAPGGSDLDDILGMSVQIKPASEWLITNPYETAVAGNWTAPKPQPEVSKPKPKPEPKKETKPKKDGCWKCAAYQQIADCEYGFCSAWHNFAGKDELCTRFKAVETVDN